MTSPDRLFTNLFSDPDITPTRLADFTQDSLNRFIAAGTSPTAPPTTTVKAAAVTTNPYADIIDRITPGLAELQTQLGDVDTSITQQRGATLTNNQVITDLLNTMRTQEGVIANAVGGYGSANYLQFYPHGLMEYTKATKPQITVLVNRLKTAATTFADDLGTQLATKLQGFEAAWQTSRDTQQQQMGKVGDNRTERTAAETDTQLAMTFAVHTIGAMFPGDVQQCSSFFDFSLLLPQAHHHKTETLSGNIVKNTATVALNRSFTNTVHLKLSNETDNAAILAFLGATADAEPNGKGVEVNAGKSRNLKLNELGNEENTYLIIKNLSDTNDAAYVLEVKN